MGLHFQPKSIRGKLLIVFLIAISPMLCMHIFDNVSNYIDVQHLADIHQHNFTTEAADYQQLVWQQLLTLNINRTKTLNSHLIAARQRRIWLFWSIISTLLGLVVILLMGNRFAQPIRRLALAANALAVGDYRKRVFMHTGDELEILGNSFNSLGESLLSHESTMREQAEMLAAMVEAARVASSTLDIRECGKAIAKVACTHLGASDSAVYRKDAEDGGVKTIGRYGERQGSAWKRLALRTASSGDYLAISERHIKTDSSDKNDAVLVGIPLVAGSHTIGAMVARFDGDYYRDDLRLGSVRADVLIAFGIHATAAIANAEVHSQTEQYSEVLADWVEHLSSVMQVTNAISPSLNLDETLKGLACATKSVLNTDECIIFLPDREGYLTIRCCCSSEWDIISQIRIRPGESESGIAFTQKRYVTHFDASNSIHPITRKLNEMAGIHSLLSVPLLVEDRAIGVITVYSKEPRKFKPKEIRLLTSIGLHAAVIVRNASLYTRESSIAETLQKGLVSEAPEEYRGLKFASRYTPALDEARIGGDFYDVTPLPNGRVGVVMADVSGKGLDAAIHLATCKYMLKALMYAHPDDPAKVLCELNDAINSYFDASFFVTLFCCVIDPKQGTLHYANAGHPPAILLAEEGKIHTCLPSTGIPIGSGYDCQYNSQCVEVKRSDMLLLYTDGVTDAIRDGNMLGVEGLHSMIFKVGLCSATALVDYIYTELSQDQAAFQRDDIALLAISFEDISAEREITTGGSDEDNSCLRLQAI